MQGTSFAQMTSQDQREAGWTVGGQDKLKVIYTSTYFDKLLVQVACDRVTLSV